MKNSYASHTQWLLSRRTFLRLGGMGTAVVTTGALSSFLGACSAPLPIASVSSSETAAPDVDIVLRAIKDTTAILPGRATNVWRYAGEVLNGATGALQTVEDSYLSTIIRVHKGQKVRIHFQNELEEESIIHWHGLILPEHMDGHPQYAVGAGESYVYEFEVTNQAGTYWFHPHPHGRTGRQVYNGLAGLFIVTDDAEQALDLPTGEYEIPLVIQDRLFDAENQFVYLADGGMGNRMDTMMAQMMGQLGDQILVNGRPDATLDVATRVYRLRVLNGSNARIYKLAWADGTPLTVIGTDDGLLERPVSKEYVTLAPGARVDLWVDFSQDAVGTERSLRSLAFSGVEMGGMMESSSLENGADFPVLTVRVGRAEAETRTLPAQLVPVEKLDPAAAVNAENPRRIELSMLNMQWTLNGRTFEMMAAATDERVKVGDLELWEFVNVPGQGMMADFMAHPMHIHGVHFQVVTRSVDPAYAAGWKSLSAGHVDEGWRDTVLVMPGERVQVLMRFTEPGLFVYHCHVLEHEDQGMMRNYLAEA